MNMHTRWKPALGFCLFVLALLTLPAIAFAHATPLHYFPAASSVLPQAPAKVEIHFSERVEPRVSSIIVLAPDGSRADLSNSAVDSADHRIYRVGMKNAGAGTYTVSWEVISADDGHFAKGTYVFSVGIQKANAPLDSGEFQTVHSSSVPEASTLALELIGNALILGSLVVLAFIWRPMRHHFLQFTSEERAFARRFQFLIVLGGASSLAGGIAYLIYKTNELASLQGTAFAEAWIHLIGTRSALFTMYRMLAMIFVIIAVLAMRDRIFSSLRTTGIEYALFAVLALIDLARARVSHAAASAFAPAFSVFVNFVHLFFKDLWIGGITAMILLLSPLVGKSRDLRSAAFVLTAFSRIAAIALGVGGVTGVYVVWLHLKSFSFLLTTDWGKRFVVLSVFAAFLLFLRLCHQLYFEPQIVRAMNVRAMNTHDQKQLPQLFAWLRFTLPGEMAMGIAILAVTSLLIITTPPLDPHYTFIRSAVSQGVVLSLGQQPDESGRFLVTARDSQANSGADVNNEVQSDVKNIVVTLTNRAAGIGPIVAPVEERFPGGYVFDQNLLAPPGVWTVNITAQRTAAYDSAASFNLNYPQETTESDAHAEERTLGPFDAVLLAAALVILALSIVLCRRSSKLNQSVLSASDASPASTDLAFSRQIAWVPSLILIAFVVLLAGGFPVVFAGVLESSFERACGQANIMNVWHESVPERDGKATGDLALPGCTVGFGLGQYHFVDAREFAYFERPARASAQLATIPAVLAQNLPTTLTFTLRDFQGHPVQGLVRDHNRILHVVIASKDFSVFSHIHVEDSGPVTPEMIEGAVFPVRYTFPKPSSYLVSVDFMERAYLFSDQFYVNVGASSATDSPQHEDFALQQNADGYDVKLKTSPSVLKAGAPATLRYHIEQGSRPLTSMTPYLAVPMHISIIRDDLMGFIHTHGLLPVPLSVKLLGESVHASHLFLPSHFGPDVEAANFAFPSAGIYHIFGEFSVDGKVVVTRFTVRVADN
jgi:methionine-rich copper-binding protein CopC/putative copper export protein